MSMIVPESSERLGGFIGLYSRKSGGTVTLASDGILISEKLARDLNISEGDSFGFTSNEGGAYTVRITGVVENYVLHHIYMPPELYAELFGAAPLYNSVLIIADEASIGALPGNSEVRAVIHTSDMKENISDSTDALEIVAIVLILLACSLAFVVLFNLTNINITERIRELATIKVLGFYNEELAMYIYRENIIVTLLGIALGLIAGIFLHAYVLMAAEIDLLMFPKIILFRSYVYAVGLSIVFAVFVNLVMNIKLSRIDMVESLKSIE
jgi:putative ABC transport system permease protein